MNSAQPSALQGGKSFNLPSQAPTQQQHQPPSQSFDAGVRRISANSTSSQATPRNSQSQKKQHKSSRRPRLADEDAMAESVAMRNANSRRGQTSITHLMNFTLAPRHQEYRNTIHRGARRSNIYGIGSGHHSSDKARYIHANYRFIVKPDGDYRQQIANADQPLEWDDVLQILASSVSQDASCPICLSHPVAPRMAKCGHIFCLPCLIRYMHSTDEAKPMPEKKARWKKCPICWDTVYISETRPVRWYAGQESAAPKEGDDVVLRLVMRQPGNTLALPRDGAEALGKADDIPWYFAAEVTDYARIMKGSEEYMKEQYDAEIQDLRQQENEDELMFGEEPEWTRKAVNSVTEAKEKIKGIGDPPAIAKQPGEKKPKRAPIKYTEVDETAPESYFIQNASHQHVVADSTPATPQEVAVPTLESKSELAPIHHHARNNADGHHPDLPYYFYQSLLHYYLAPLDIRILKSAFGNFASFPATLLPRVERVSTGHIMDEELRKRTKYLSHLPYGCEVGFLECNWTDVVPPEILLQFRDEIDRRRQRNRDKEYREEKERLRAEKVEDDARWANARRNKPIIISEGISKEDFNTLPSSIDGSNASPPWPIRQGSSFASLASPSTSPSGPKTVWGTTRITPSSPDLAARPDDGDDGWLQSWETEFRAENDLIAQTQALSLEAAGSVPASSGGKKKKAKKITLMSTNGRRAA